MSYRNLGSYQDLSKTMKYGRTVYRSKNMNPLAVTKLLSDEYTVKILTATFKVPRTANYLCMKFNIPIAACYRRINELEELGLIQVTEKILTQRGKRVSLYQSTLRSAYLTFEGGRLKAMLELSDSSRCEEEAVMNMVRP